MNRKSFLRASGMLPFIADNLGAKPPANAAGISAGRNLTHPLAEPATHPLPEPRDFFYKPEGAWAADFIPMYAEGKFQLFYLLDWRNAKDHGEGTPWYRLSTTDFVNFEEHGEVIPRGTKEEQDLYVFTGSAIKAGDKYHIFYTGHNHHLSAAGKPMQAVMHATSDDLQHWTKIPGHTFYAPTDKYEQNDWRDPFVFFNEETKEYNMLLTARLNKGIPRRRGVTAICASKDLINWQVRDHLYAPNQFITMECPDLFKMGDWWYLIFSEYNDLFATRYRMSRSLKGPWLTPKQDSFDGHAYYAAKTASDGKKRFLFGWNPTRSEAKDNGAWNWGGNLVVHEVSQQPNGELTVRVPDTVRNAFNKPVQQELRLASGGTPGARKEIEIMANEGFDAVAGGKMPEKCRISATIVFDKPPRNFGCILRCSDDFDKGYYIRFEPSRNRLVYDMWPRRISELPHMAEFERLISVQPGTPVTVEIFTDGNKGVVYVNNTVAMNFRAYDIPEGNWGFFVTEGTARFKNIELATL